MTDSTRLVTNSQRIAPTRIESVLKVRFVQYGRHRRLTKKLLREMESFIGIDVKYLHGELQSCLGFSLLSVRAPKEEQLLVIGEPDEFFERLIEYNKKFQGHLESDLKRLAELCTSLSRLLRSSTSSATRKILDEIPSVSCAFLEENVA